MKVRYITSADERIAEIHFEHAVDHGVGYGQLWVDGRFHLEFTATRLRQLAKEATELADGLGPIVRDPDAWDAVAKAGR